MKELTEEQIHIAITHHIEDYTNFMNEVLELEMTFGIPRKECIDIVIKRYPHLKLN